MLRLPLYRSTRQIILCLRQFQILWINTNFPSLPVPSSIALLYRYQSMHILEMIAEMIITVQVVGVLFFLNNYHSRLISTDKNLWLTLLSRTTAIFEFLGRSVRI